jgi:hypothetical protein
MTQEILIDGHVHIHPCFSFAKVLDSAMENLSANARTPRSTNCLIFTEADGNDFFGQLLQRNAMIHSALNNWSLLPTQESSGVIARHSDGNLLYLIRGRQIMTLEDIEVHGILTTESFKDGLPLHVTLQQIHNSTGLAVLPWGFGKWLGHRGTILRQCLSDDFYPFDFFGDNGVRPAFMPEPAILRDAKSHGIPIISGSDPFPFVGQEKRVGTAGLSVRGKFDPLEPASSLRRILSQPLQSARPFRTSPGLVRFIELQLRMQFRKRWLVK